MSVAVRKDAWSELKEMPPRICRICLTSFTTNHNKACRRHPESYAGETAQRWMAPGDTEGGGTVHNFWTCCGETSIDSPGCCYTPHLCFGEEQSIDLRRPGAGVNDSD